MATLCEEGSYEACCNLQPFAKLLSTLLGLNCPHHAKIIAGMVELVTDFPGERFGTM